jgi:DNA topoisomerase-1
LFTLTLARAFELLAQPKKVRGGSTPIKELGKHPTTNEEMAVYSGKYGPYIKCGKVNVSLPDDLEPEKVTTELAQELLAPKITKKEDKTEKGANKKALKNASSKATKSGAKDSSTTKAAKNVKVEKQSVAKSVSKSKVEVEKEKSSKVIRRKAGGSEKALT